MTKIKDKNQIWIFNHYAYTPKTGPHLRHFNFSKELITKKFLPTVFAANELHFNGNTIDTRGKKYIEMKDEGPTFIFVKTSKYKGNGLSRVKNMFSFFVNLFFVTKDYAKVNGTPDVIIGSSAHPLTAIAGILIAKKYAVPCIVEIRDLWPEAIFSYGKLKENSLIGRLLTLGERWIYYNADAIVFTKEGDVDHVKEMKWDIAQGGRIDLDKCYYINNGVNLKEFKLDAINYVLTDEDLTDDSFKVTYTGTIRPVNNVDNIIDAAKIVSETDKEVKFLIYGNGSEFERLRKRVEHENVTNVRLKGYIEKKYIPYILSRSSINILNYSKTQYNWSRGNSSNKLFEYMASGKPVISTVKMGYCILDKYKCGFSLAEGTPEELADAIIHIKNFTNEQYNEMGQNAVRGVKDFDYEVLTSRLISVINDLVKREIS